MTWDYGQVAALSLGHRLPGAIEAQQLEVLLLQILRPGFRVLSWGERGGGRATADSFGQGTLNGGCDRPPVPGRITEAQKKTIKPLQ